MSDILTIDVEPRERAGKGASRAVRRAGKVPAVIYGGKEEPISIQIETRALVKHLSSGRFMTNVYELTVEGKKVQTLPRDVQFHPVTSVPMHVDFLRLVKGATIVVEVPVNFLNEEQSPAIKSGGVLNVVRHTVEIEAPVNAIPEELDVDVGGLEMGESIHISDVNLPEGSKPTITDRDFTIATVVAPSAVRSAAEEEEDAEAAEEAAAAEEEEGSEDS